MKFIKKVDDNFQLKNLFNEHLTKFNFKHEQELTFLEDVRNFIEKKSQMELQYSQSLSKLCNQYMNKSEYQINNDDSTEIYIPEKWKLILEQYMYIAEKKQVSSKSILMNCEYFKKIKDQKNTLNQTAINNMKSMQEILSDTHHNSELAYRSYTFDQILCDQLNKKTKITNSNLEKKLNKKGIKWAKFKKNLEQITQSEQIFKERKKKLDFSKLNYVTTNFCENQQLLYYFSMELPELMRLQNGNMDTFIDDCLNSLVFKDIESSKFLMKQFEETVDMSSQDGSQQSSHYASNALPNLNSSENFFLDKESCFQNLVQFDLKTFDPDFEKMFEFTFQKENMKTLGNDYMKWSNKLNELENLMKTMLSQINEKRLNLVQSDETTSSSHEKPNLVSANQNDYLMDLKLEKQRFLISEKKMQMIQLQAKIDALGSFNISLKELDDYNNAAKFEEKKLDFQSDLHQNLELWETLMKSIDDFKFSDDRYE